jgi:hypothetical protein
MKKIYFAKNWGLTSQQMCKNYIMQTPNCSGIWEDIQVTYNIKEADYLIIEDNCSIEEANHFNNKSKIYFSREALDSLSHQRYLSTDYIRSSFWDNTGYLYTKWVYGKGACGGIYMTYDELKNEKMPNKNKLIGTIQSNKTMTPTHIDRVNFIRTMAKNYDLHVYGSIDCKNKDLPENNKRFALDEYKYCLTFDNQMNIDNFFGTQFTDSILRWTIPFYGGGANLSKFFPEKSFIKINPSDKSDINRIKSIIENKDDYNDRIDALCEARDLILNKYNIWPTIKNIINKQE